MLSTNPVALVLHDFSSIRCCLGGAHFLSPCPGPPQVNDHHCTFQRLISLVLTIKKLFVQLRSARIQAKATQYISGFYWPQFTIKNSFCLLLLAKAKCTRVLGAFFDRVTSTLTFEYQPSTWGSEYEYSKNGTRVRVLYSSTPSLVITPPLHVHSFMYRIQLTELPQTPYLDLNEFYASLCFS